MSTRLYGFLLMAARLGACASAPQETLRVSGARLFVPVTVNGVPTEALLDSGAEMTLIDAGFAAGLDLRLAGGDTARGTGGTQSVRFAEGVSLTAPGFASRDATVAVIDLSDISSRLVGEPVTVVMGREIFDSGRYLVDIEGRRFERLSRETEPAGVALELSDERGIRQLPVIVDDLPPTTADLDVGNGSEVLVGRPYALSSGLLDRDLIVLDRLHVAGVDFPGGYRRRRCHGDGLERQRGGADPAALRDHGGFPPRYGLAPAPLSVGSGVAISS